MFEQDNPSYLSGTHTSGAPQGFNQPTFTNPPRHFSEAVRMGYGSQDQVATPNGTTPSNGALPSNGVPPSNIPPSNGAPGLLATGMTIVSTGLGLGAAVLGNGIATGIVGAVLPDYTFKDGFKSGAYGAVIYGVAGLILSGAIKSKQQ